MLAQISMEFMALVSILFIILLMTIYYNSSYYIQMRAVKTYSDAQSMADQIASEINLALKSSDGYSRYFYISNKISDSFDYNITVDNYFVELQWSSGYVRSIILTPNVSGNIMRGQNLIKNIKGTVYANQ